jgi:hypothetical protein
MSAMGRSCHEERQRLSQFCTGVSMDTFACQDAHGERPLLQNTAVAMQYLSASWKSCAMNILNLHEMFWSTLGQPVATILTALAPVREA